MFSFPSNSNLRYACMNGYPIYPKAYIATIWVYKSINIWVVVAFWVDLNRDDAWGAALGSVINAGQPVSIASSLDLGIQAGASINARWALYVGRDMSGIVYTRLPKTVYILMFGAVHQTERGLKSAIVYKFIRCTAAVQHAFLRSRPSQVRASEVSVTCTNPKKFNRSVLRSVSVNASAPSLYRAQALAV